MQNLSHAALEVLAAHIHKFRPAEICIVIGVMSYAYTKFNVYTYSIYIYMYINPIPETDVFAAFSPADLHHAVLVALVASEDPNLRHCPLHLTSPRKRQPGLHGSEDEAQPTPQDWDQLGTWVKGSRVFFWAVPLLPFKISIEIWNHTIKMV